MKRQETVTLTNMCMITHKDEVLVQNRLDPNWGGITFPGGHVEKHEPFHDALIREIKEETGLTIHAPQLCGIKDWIEDDGSRYIVLLYQTDQFEGELRSSREGPVYWVKLKDLRTLALAEGMDKTLRIFMETELSEYFMIQKNDEWVHELN